MIEALLLEASNYFSRYFVMSSSPQQQSSESTSLLGFTSDNLSLQNFKVKCENKLRNNRGAILVLIWNFFTMTMYHFLSDTNNQVFGKLHVALIHKNHFGSALFVMWIFYPLAGWLGDVRFGRYKTLRYSIWIMWIGIMLTTIAVIISKFAENADKALGVMINFLYLIMAIGFSGFQANIIQFSIDQLTDASSADIRAFLNWYVWTYVSSGLIPNYFLFCLPQDYHILTLVYVTASLTIAICLDILFNKFFVKEPVTANPFRLVVKVIKYTIKNKSLRQRSAFTYWEEKPPPRIDFGKDKYGGPFTNEQVEDVKTFLRMSVVISSFSIFGGTLLYSIAVKGYLMNHFKGVKIDHFGKCLTGRAVSHFYLYPGTVLIPLYRFVIYPLFRKWIPNVRILTKLIIGVSLILVTFLTEMILEIVGHKNTNSASVRCLLRESSPFHTHAVDVDISYKWLLIPQLFMGLGLYSVVLASFEFVCAQSPYSMKGILFGFIYFINGVSLILTYGLFYPLKSKKLHWKWLGCGVWFFTIAISITVTTIGVLSCIKRWYKTRDRDDDLPNNHKFANDYWAKYGNHQKGQIQ